MASGQKEEFSVKEAGQNAGQAPQVSDLVQFAHYLSLFITRSVKMKFLCLISGEEG